MHGTFTWRDEATGKEYSLESMDLAVIPREDEQVDLVFATLEASRDLNVTGLFLVERVKYQFHRILVPGDDSRTTKKDRQSVSIYVQPLDPMAQDTISRIKQIKDLEEQKTWEAGKKQRGKKPGHV